MIDFRGGRPSTATGVLSPEIGVQLQSRSSRPLSADLDLEGAHVVARNRCEQAGMGLGNPYMPLGAVSDAHGMPSSCRLPLKATACAQPLVLHWEPSPGMELAGGSLDIMRAH